MAATVQRWRLQNMETDEVYTVALNPNEMSNYRFSKEYDFASYAGGRMRGVEARRSPGDFSFKGVVRAQSHHDALVEWQRTPGKVRITDHLGRVFVVMIRSLDMTDRRPVGEDTWRFEYTFNCMLLRQLSTQDALDYVEELDTSIGEVTDSDPDAPILTPPATPTSQPTASDRQATTITITVASVDAATTYEIQRSQTGSTSWRTISLDIDTTVVDDQLFPSSNYSYRYRAINDDGISAWSPTLATSTTAETASPPADPTAAPREVSTSDDSITLTVPAVSGATTYEVEVSINGTSGWTQVGSGSSRTVTDDGLLTSTHYYYRYRAANTLGTSDWSPVLNAVTDSGSVFTGIGAISATDLRRASGVRVFPTYTGKVYGELVVSGSSALTTRRTTARKWLTDLNLGFLSQKMTPNLDDAVLDFIVAMSTTYGLKSVLTVGEPFKTYTTAQWTQMMGYLTGKLAGHVLMVTGQNEINHVRGGGKLPSNWASIAATHQQKLWSEVNGAGGVNAQLEADGHDPILVGTPSLWSGDIPTHDKDLGTLAPLVENYCDAINWHLYPRGGDPTYQLDHFETVYTNQFGTTKPIWCTEAGYFTAPNYTGGAANITKASQAIYVPKLILEYAKRGWHVSYFELLNDPDPSGADREKNLGLVDVATDNVLSTNWTAKASYNALKSLLALSGGESGETDITVSGTGIQSLVVNHSGGNRVLLWRRGDIENSSGAAIDLVPATRTATITSPSGTVTRNVGRSVVSVDISGGSVTTTTGGTTGSTSSTALKTPCTGIGPRAASIPSGRGGDVGFVVADVFWSQLQPTQNGPIDVNGTGTGSYAQVKTALNLASTYGIGVRVRVHCGDEAPSWAKSLGGNPLTLVVTDGPDADGLHTYTCGRWWRSEYLSAWGALMTKLATLLEGEAAVREVASHPATTAFAEPFQRGFSTLKNKSTGKTNVQVIYEAMLQTNSAAGYAQVEMSGTKVVGPAKLDAAAILWPTETITVGGKTMSRWESFGWTTTRLYMPFNPFQQWQVTNDSATAFAYTGVTDPAGWTQTAISTIKGTMGDRVVIANNSLRVPLVEAGAKYPTMYAAFPTSGYTGFQTATQSRILEAYQTVAPSGTDTQALSAVLDVAFGVVVKGSDPKGLVSMPVTALGARSVELPPGWQDVLTSSTACAAWNTAAAANP